VSPFNGIDFHKHGGSIALPEELKNKEPILSFDFYTASKVISELKEIKRV
jgi:hypothetical protein